MSENNKNKIEDVITKGKEENTETKNTEETKDTKKTENTKENKERKEVEIKLSIDSEIYDLYKIFFEQYKKDNENKDLSDEKIHGKIFTILFKETFINKL